jgi:hypothetical protein
LLMYHLQSRLPQSGKTTLILFINASSLSVQMTLGFGTISENCCNAHWYDTASPVLRRQKLH